MAHSQEVNTYALFIEVRDRYYLSAEFKALVDRSVLIGHSLGVSYTMRRPELSVGVALVLKERGPAWDPHPTTQRDKDLRLMSLAALGYLAYRQRGESALDMEINLEELVAALDRLCYVEEEL